MTVDCDIACAHGGDPVFADKQQVGSVTSAGYGHRVQKNIAYAYITPDMAKIGTELELGILGDRYAAVVVESVIYDPENLRVKA
jgi:dimethylglycine dehydrogenase